MLAERRRDAGRLARHGAELQRRGGHRIGADAGLVEHGEHRVFAHGVLVRRQFAERLVGRPERAGLLQGGAHLLGGATRHPRLDHGAQRRAGLPAAGIGLEIDAGLRLDLAECRDESPGCRQRIDVAVGEDADHDEAAVPGPEVAAEGAEDLVAVARPVDLVHHGLAQVAQRRGDRERHVLQRQDDALPLPRHPPMPFCSQDRHRPGIGGRQIPRRRHGIDRPLVADRSGDHGKAGDGVHGVVDMGRAVARAHDVEGDQVGAPLGQLLVGQPTARRHVGGEDAAAFARRRDQRGEQLASFRTAQVDGDRALALVEARPVDRAAILRDRPAVVVEAALDMVETDDVGAQLGERHAAQGGRNESRAFDDAKAGENAGHVCVSCLSCYFFGRLFFRFSSHQPYSGVHRSKSSSQPSSCAACSAQNGS